MNEYNLVLFVTFILMGAVSNMRSQNPGIALGSRGYINNYLLQDNPSFGDKTDQDLSWDVPMQSTMLPYDYFRVTYTSPNVKPGAALCPLGNSGNNMSTINSANNGPSAINTTSDFVGPSFDNRNNNNLFYSEPDNNMVAPDNNSDGQNGDSTGDNSTPQDENLITNSSGTSSSTYGTYKNTYGMTIPGLPVDDSSDGSGTNNSENSQLNRDFTGPVFGNYGPNIDIGEDNPDINNSESSDNNSNTFSNQDFKGPVFDNYNSNGMETPGSNLPSNSIDASADSYGDSNLEPFKVNQSISSYFYGPVLANQGQPADSATTDPSDMENSQDIIDNSFSHESGNELGITSFVGPVFGNYANNEESMPGTLSQTTNQSSTNMQNQNAPASTSQAQNTNSSQTPQAQNNLPITPINVPTDNSGNDNQSLINTQSQTPSSSNSNNTPTSIPTDNNSQSQNTALVSNGDSQSTEGTVNAVVDPTQNSETHVNSADSSQSSSNDNLNQSQVSPSIAVITPPDNTVSTSSNNQHQSSASSNQITTTLPITSADQSQTSQDQNNSANPLTSNTDTSNPNQSSAIPNGPTKDAQTSIDNSNPNQKNYAAGTANQYTNVVSISSQPQNNVNVITQNTPNSSFDNTNQASSSPPVPIQPQDTQGTPSVSKTADQSNYNSSTLQSGSTQDTLLQQTVTDPNSTIQNVLSNTTPITGGTSNVQATLTKDNSNIQPTDISNTDKSNSSTSNPSLTSPEPNQRVIISPANGIISSGSVSTSNSSTTTSSGDPSNGSTSTVTNSSASSPSSNGSNSSSSSSNNATGTNTNSKFLSTNEIPISNTSATKSASTTIKANIKLYLLAILFIALL